MKNFAYMMGKLAGAMAKRSMPASPMGNMPNTPMASAVGTPNTGVTGAQNAGGAGNANWMRMLMAQKNKAKMPQTGMPGQAVTTPQPPTMPTAIR